LDNYNIEKNFLIGKLGFFSKYLGRITQQEIDYFNSIFPKLNSCVVYGDEEQLNKLGMYLVLVKHGINRSFRVESFSQYVDGFYSDNYETASFYKNTEVPLLFIYVHKMTPLVSKNEEYIMPVFNNRSMANLPTVVLCEIDQGLARTQELPFMRKISLNKNSIADKSSKKYSK